MNIVVVDDEPAILRLEAHWLERAGHRCRQAASAAEALQLLEAEPADLIVLDIGLPDQSGLVLARTVSSRYPAIPIIMATAVADFASAAEAMRAGAVDYLVKPVQPALFLEAVERGLARRATPDAERLMPGPGQPLEAPAVPQHFSGATAPAIDDLFRAMCVAGASDLHISVDLPPMIRKDGQMLPLDANAPRLSPADVTRLLADIIPGKNRAEFEQRHDSDFAYEIEGLARFRGNIFMDRKGMGAVFRIIPTKILTAEQLGLSPHILQLCHLTKGLVLVTGPTGSGKSTTLCAMVDYINRTRTDHIITIEDPIEFVHETNRCVIHQREVHTHTRSFKDALRAALREDPDIILVGEMRDLETIAIAIETAETGHLVFGTLHTTTAISTVDRIIDQFPADRQAQIRVMLSESLRGVIAQTLCRKIGGGRVAALEVLIVNSAITNLIREGKTFQIASMMQVGKGVGMVTLNDALMDLVTKKLTTPEEAYAKAADKAGFDALLKRSGAAAPAPLKRG
ncbi:MAG TPA: PilT/PilU family type 4a pilus ATPase [Vicinamibacterales bacterium]|nr:PilT/PilU family type 4a pilus ATPase [Vicinamibacterales bacterium]